MSGTIYLIIVYEDNKIIKELCQLFLTESEAQRYGKQFGNHQNVALRRIYLPEMKSINPKFR